MKSPRDIIKQWIDDVNTLGKNLTEWELGFMETVTDRVERLLPISEKQEEILERIYTEKVK